MTIKAQLEELTSKLSEKKKEHADLLALVDAGEDIPEDWSDQADTLVAEAKAIDDGITALMDRDKAIQVQLEAVAGFGDRSGDIANVRGIHVGDTTATETTATATKTVIPTTVRRYGQLTAFSGTRNGMPAEERAYRFGNYALAKLQIDMPGRFHNAFPRAQQFAMDQWGIRQPFAVHGEGAGDTTGSHVFVPDEFGTDLIALRDIYGIARRVMKVRPMSTETRTDPRRKSGLTAYFTGENAAGTESDSDWDDVSLTPKKLMCLSRMSKELSEDAVIDFGNALAEEISIAFAQKEDESAFNGTGISTDGGMTGIRTHLATLTAATAGNGLVQAAGSTWASITLANLTGVIAVLPGYADIAGQVSWICHKTFFWEVMVTLLNAAGGTTPSDIQGGKNPMFLGYPVEYSNAYPNTTASGAIPVTLGNYKQAGSFGDRRAESIEFSESASVGGQSLWERDQIGVKGTERFDAKWHDFGTDVAGGAGPVVGLETQ